MVYGESWHQLHNILLQYCKKRHYAPTYRVEEFFRRMWQFWPDTENICWNKTCQPKSDRSAQLAADADFTVPIDVQLSSLIHVHRMDKVLLVLSS